MNKLAWIIGGLITATLILGFVYRDLLILMVFKTYVKPATTFAETAAPLWMYSLYTRPPF